MKWAQADSQGQGELVPHTIHQSPWWHWGQGPQVAGAAGETAAGLHPPPQPAPHEVSAWQRQMPALQVPTQPLQEPKKHSAAVTSSLLDELLESPEFQQKARPFLEMEPLWGLEDVEQPTGLEAPLSEEEYWALLEEL
ncbi:Double homeobox protein 4-like protein 4 [Plecturocebus cupreus]